MPFVLAAGAAPPFFAQVTLLLLAAALIAYLCVRFGLMPIIGFLVAGALIGPHGLGLVRDQALVDAAAEVGVILLLFTIGIEFSLEKLARIQKLIFGGGGLQVLLATGATAGLLLPFGVPVPAALFTGFLVALSSTAIVLKLLGDRGEMNTETGQVALGLLIFQDLAIIVMVLLVPMLAGAGGGAAGVAWALGKAALLIVLVLVVARRLLPPLLEAVQRTCSPEVFLLSVIAICFGTALLTSLAGVSLSLGAFLAGLVVSESRFSEHAMGEILPLQVLFSATFFVSVGMLLDVGFVLAQLPLVGAVVLAVLIVKTATAALSVRALGYATPVALASGLLLAQVGEFSFVLERAGRELGLLPAGLAEGSQAFIAATVLLMVATPALHALGTRLGRRLDARHTQTQATRMDEAPLPELPPLENHVVVAGYGDAARQLGRVLQASGIPLVVTTLNPGGALEAEAEGLTVLRGDASRRHVLEHAGVERAKMLVVADDDPGQAHRIAAVARPLNPTMRLVVRTRATRDSHTLAHTGADRVVTEELESIVALFHDVLRTYEIAPAEIDRHEDEVRADGYAALRSAPTGAAAPVTPCAFDPDCLDTRRVLLRDGMPIAGREVTEIGFETRWGLHLRGIERAGHPSTGFGERLAPGDVLVLAGTTDAFARAAPAFRTSESFDLPSEPAGLGPADASRPVTLAPGPRACAHLPRPLTITPRTAGCEECLRMGDTWVHLRVCMACGHVGCCDSSRNKHATAHHHATGHPVVRSAEPGETWGWCYVDRQML